MTVDPDHHPALDRLRDVLRNRGEVRVELAVALGVRDGPMPSARVLVRGDGNRWQRVDAPLLVPPKGGSRGDLLRLLAALADEEPTETVLADEEPAGKPGCANCGASWYDCIDGGEAVCCNDCDHR